MNRMDEAITHWINSQAGQSPSLDAFMVAVSAAGVPVMIVLCVIQWWTGPDRLHVRHTLIATGLSFLAGLALNQVILLFVHRIRPYDAGLTHLIVERSRDWSFPSDHATAVAAIVAAFALHREYRRAGLLAIVAVFVMWSRIFVGTHYFTDILGGIATGLIAAGAIRRLYPAGTRLDRLLTRLF
jgi:undecaprenyl-diphosphatase